MREYTENYYLPAALVYGKRAVERGALGKQLTEWQERLQRHWPALIFGKIQIEPTNGLLDFRIQIYLDEIDPDMIEAELYTSLRPGEAPERHKLVRGEPLVGAANGWTYTAQFETNRNPDEFTARVIPRHPEASVPLEAAQILWQR